MHSEKKLKSYEVLKLEGVYLWHIGLYIPAYESVSV